MAAAMNFHTYSKLEKNPSFIVLGENNEYSYSRRAAIVDHTPLKRKRNRDVSTPTGLTPRLVDKNQVCRGQKQKKLCLHRFLSRFPPSQPISNEYWWNCVVAIREEAGTSRTGASCRSFYNRTLLNAPAMGVSEQHLGGDKNEDLSGISCLEDITSNQLLLKDAACQTDFVIPIVHNSPLPVQDQQEAEASDLFVDSETAVHDILRNRLVSAHKLDASLINATDAHNLIVSLFSGESIDILAKKIFRVKNIRKNIWKLFLSEIEDDCKYLTQRRLSYLSDTGYSALVSFDRLTVVQEMLHLNPLLLDVLLSASISLKAKECRTLQKYCSRVWPCVWNNYEEEVEGHVSHPEIYLSGLGQ